MRIVDCGLRYSTASGSKRVNHREARIKGQTGRYRFLYCINPQSAIRNPQSIIPQNAFNFNLPGLQLVQAFHLVTCNPNRRYASSVAYVL